jgi:hypothetical protein
MIEQTSKDLNDEEIDMLGSLEDCLEVFELVGDKDRFEIIRVSRTLMERTAETIGYDIGYWGGDCFSAISDSVVLPMWHGAPKSSFELLLPFVELLNQNLLFESVTAARSFREFYLSQEWAETEMSENQICVQRIEAIKLREAR